MPSDIFKTNWTIWNEGLPLLEFQGTGESKNKKDWSAGVMEDWNNGEDVRPWNNPETILDSIQDRVPGFHCSNFSRGINNDKKLGVFLGEIPQFMGQT